MTCIIGLEHNGTAYVGADSSVAEGWTVRESLLPKVFQRDVFLIGSTGSIRLNQLLWQHLDVRAQHEDENDSTYIVCGFIEAVRGCLKTHGYAKVDSNVEEGGFFLVGHRGKVYRVSNSYGISRVADGYTAVGCGAEYALGAMKALVSLEPVERIRQSLAIAEHFSGGVIGPFTVLELKDFT